MSSGKLWPTGYQPRSTESGHASSLAKIMTRAEAISLTRCLKRGQLIIPTDPCGMPWLAGLEVRAIGVLPT